MANEPTTMEELKEDADIIIRVLGPMLTANAYTKCSVIAALMAAREARREKDRVAALLKAELEPELYEALADMVAAFKPFTAKNIGFPGSDARLEQDAQIAAHRKAIAALAEARGEA